MGGDALAILSSWSEFMSTSSPFTKLLFRSFLFSIVMLASGLFSVILLSIMFSAAGLYYDSIASSRFLIERYFWRLLLCLKVSYYHGCFVLTLRRDVLSWFLSFDLFSSFMASSYFFNLCCLMISLLRYLFSYAVNSYPSRRSLVLYCWSIYLNLALSFEFFDPSLLINSIFAYFFALSTYLTFFI